MKRKRASSFSTADRYVELLLMVKEMGITSRLTRKPPNEIAEIFRKATVKRTSDVPEEHLEEMVWGKLKKKNRITSGRNRVRNWTDKEVTARKNATLDRETIINPRR